MVTQKHESLTSVQLDLLTCISDRTLHENEDIGVNLEVAVQQMRNQHPQLTSTEFWYANGIAVTFTFNK